MAYHVTIQWLTREGDKSIQETFSFPGESEKAAFLQGVEEAVGQADFEIVEESDE